jgi:hypothetical protein
MTMHERRQHQEDRAYTLSNRAQDQNFMQAWVTYKTAVPGQPVPDFYQMAKDGRINLAQLNLYTASLKDSKSDDVTAYNNFYSRIARREDSLEFKAEIMASPLISDPTKIHFLKAISDDGIKEAFHDIDHVTNAGQDNPAPDRLLKGHEMRQKLRSRLERGEDPRKAKDAVINEYTVDLGRTKASLPQTTTHLSQVGGKSNDPYSIDNAMRAAADTLVKKQSQAKNQREIQQAEDEYQAEMEDLKKLRNLARDYLLVDEVNERKRIEERKAKDNQLKRPGSN